MGSDRGISESRRDKGRRESSGLANQYCNKVSPAGSVRVSKEREPFFFTPFLLQLCSEIGVYSVYWASLSQPWRHDWLPSSWVSSAQATPSEPPPAPMGSYCGSIRATAGAGARAMGGRKMGGGEGRKTSSGEHYWFHDFA